MQVFEHAVVRENLHLIVRKDHRQKTGTLPGSFSCLKNARGSGAAMMTIGDVERGNFCECIFDEGDVVCIRNNPRSVPNSIFGCKVDGWGCSRFAIEQIVQ